MQRFISITAIALVVAMLLLPATPQCCADSDQPELSDHAGSSAVGQTHEHMCGAMHHSHQTAASVNQKRASIRPASYAGQCPMNCCCCMQASSSKHAILASQAHDVSSLVTQNKVSKEEVAFSSTGLSSHTDRGPPSRPS